MRTVIVFIRICFIFNRRAENGVSFEGVVFLQLEDRRSEIEIVVLISITDILSLFLIQTVDYGADPAMSLHLLYYFLHHRRNNTGPPRLRRRIRRHLTHHRTGR